jgi:hypothetical protein
MAIIRTQVVDGQRRIITKNGKVSCSCCEQPPEPSCCMYPADELGNLYGADDLPDAVTVNWTDRFTGSMSKSGSGYAGGGATLQVVNGIWRLSDSDGNRNVGRCLIRGDGNLTQGDDLVEDQFADEYNVQIAAFPNSEFPFLFNATVTRNDLCNWTYFDEDSFTTVSLVFSEFLQKWTVDGISGEDLVNWLASGLKEAPQNNPVGTYEVTFAFNLGEDNQFGTEGVTITVSEA